MFSKFSSRSTVVLAGLAVAALALTGCSSNTAKTAAPTTSPSTGTHGTAHPTIPASTDLTAALTKALAASITESQKNGLWLVSDDHAGNVTKFVFDPNHSGAMKGAFQVTQNNVVTQQGPIDLSTTPASKGYLILAQISDMLATSGVTVTLDKNNGYTRLAAPKQPSMDVQIGPDGLIASVTALSASNTEASHVAILTYHVPAEAAALFTPKK
jgi:hypothetical protein